MTRHPEIYDPACGLNSEVYEENCGLQVSDMQTSILFRLRFICLNGELS